MARVPSAMAEIEPTRTPLLGKRKNQILHLAFDVAGHGVGAIEPLCEPCLTHTRGGIGVRSCLLPQGRDGMVSQGRDLPRVADQPALKIAGAHFGMELNGESRADRERLILALWRRCEALRADRQIEGIPMPMKNGNALLARALQLAFPARFGQLDRSPPDIRRSPGDACPQGLSEDLRSEADCQKWTAQTEMPAQQPHLVVYPWVV